MEKWEYKILEFTTGIFSPGEVKERTEYHGEMESFVAFRETGEKKTMFGVIKKISVPLSIEKIEYIFNKLGEQGWNLCETVPLITNTAHAFRYGTRTTAVQFIFKRQIKTNVEK